MSNILKQQYENTLLENARLIEACNHTEAQALGLATENAALEARVKKLETALVVWQNAYKTGRNEPLAQAFEYSAALSPAQDAPSPWRPIETAPKDTKSRLVWVPENECIYCVSWEDETGWVVFGGRHSVPYCATHWMPLPPSPEKKPMPLFVEGISHD